MTVAITHIRRLLSAVQSLVGIVIATGEGDDSPLQLQSFGGISVIQTSALCMLIAANYHLTIQHATRHHSARRSCHLREHLSSRLR